MSTSQYYCVYFTVFRQQKIDVFLYKIVSSIRFELVVFDQWNPHGTCYTGDSDVWIQLPDFQRI